MQFVDPPAGQPRRFMAQTLTPCLNAKIGGNLDACEIRPDHPSSGGAQPRGDGGADPRRRAGDESGAGQTSSLSLNLSTLPDAFIGSSSTKVTPRGTL